MVHFLNCYLSHENDVKKTLSVKDDLYQKKRRRKSSFGRVNLEDDLEWMNITRSSVLREIKEQMNNSFHFSIVENIEDMGHLLEMYAIKKLSVLRAFCKANGVQLHLKDYEFNSTSVIFHDEDFQLFFPVAKCSSTKSSYADCLVGLCRKELHNNNLLLAHRYICYAILINKEIYGPIHMDLSTCYRILGMIQFLTENFQQAIISQREAIMLIEKARGHDDSMLIHELQLASVYYFSQNLDEDARNGLFRARQIFHISSPSLTPHPMLAKIDLCLGVITLHSGDLKNALYYLLSAQKNMVIMGKNHLSKMLACQQMLSYCYLLSLDFERCRKENKKMFDLAEEVESRAYPLINFEDSINDLEEEQKRRFFQSGNPGMSVREILQITSTKLRLGRVYMLNLIAFVSDLEKRTV